MSIHSCTRRDFLKIMGLSATALGMPQLGFGNSQVARKPNIVFVLTDDMGYGDLGCYGHPIMKTPNLDKFATQGVKFAQCYSASSVCSPSRSASLTGRTPYRNGVFTWIPEGREIYLRESEITIGKLLKERGYETCHVGKWHLNGKFNSPEQSQPDDHGYDWWFATQNNAAPSHKNPENFVRNGEKVGKMEGFSAPLIVEEGINWLKNHRDPNKPFFLAVWMHEPHLPIESDSKFMDIYPEIDDPDQRQHHGNITQVDHAFGMLMKVLDEMALTENTFVIFTSDNGPEGDGKRRRTRGSTGGLRGRKRWLYEGGIRVPGIVRWPGHVKPGTVCHQPIIGSDIFTTICDIVDIPLPSDRTIDGASILPAFEGKPIQRKVPMYWRYHGAPKWQIAVRKGDWKILASKDLNQFEFYNLKNDRNETNNLIEIEPERFEATKQTLIKLNAEIEEEGPDWWKNYTNKKTKK